MKKTIINISAMILTSAILALSSVSSASAGTTTYTKVGNYTFSNNWETGESCTYSKVGNTTYRNCY